MNLKKQIFLSIALLAPWTALVKAASEFDTDVTGHTFFTARPLFQSGSPEKEIFYHTDRLGKKDHRFNGDFQIVGFYSQSVKSKDLARYFFPFNQAALSVVETKNFDVEQSNLPRTSIEARNFNIVTNQDDANPFQSTICISPEQKVGGIGITYQQTLWRSHDHKPRIYFEASAPVQWVQNRVGLKETIINNGGGVETDLNGQPTIGLDGAPHVDSMVAALSQSSWKYGKMDNKARHRWGVADVELKLGWNSHLTEHCHLSSYVGGVVPTGTRVHNKVAEHVFAPVVGNNHHWGAIFGSHADFHIWHHNDHIFKMEYDLSGRYLFQNHQVRSFDLVDKQWSRYIEMYSNIQAAEAASLDDAPLNSNAGTSGINILTSCVKVDPRFTYDVNSALVYNYKKLVIEIGYNFFAREAEHVKITEGSGSNAAAWQSAAVKDITGTGFTNIARNIKNNFMGADIPLADYTPLKKSDLDANSAAHPAMLSNILYGGIAVDFGHHVPTIIGIGGSYEFGRTNAVLHRWTTFGKIALSF